MRHQEAVRALAFSPDGRFALSESGDATLRLWRVPTGECLRTFAGHTDGVLAVAFIPDGRMPLSGGWDKTIRVWDVESGDCLQMWSLQDNRVLALAFTPDGHHVLPAGKAVLAFELATGCRVPGIVEADFVAYSVVLGPDGRLALAGGKKLLRAWEWTRWERPTQEMATSRPFYPPLVPSAAASGVECDDLSSLSFSATWDPLVKWRGVATTLASIRRRVTGSPAVLHFQRPRANN